MQQKQFLALGSILLSLIVLGLKLLAYRATGSVAFLSDALETLVNVATAISAYVAIRIGAKPADSNHPYGHHKAEYFSAVLEGVLVVLAALAIFREAYFALQNPLPPSLLFSGFFNNGLATALNAIWGVLLVQWGKRHRSPALAAGGRHLLSDVASSLAVLIGLGIAYLTGWALLDPILGILVALYVLWSGWQVLRGSIGGLMDEAAPSETLEDMRRIIAANAEGALEAHDLRSRHAGGALFLDFHLVVPGTISVVAAHEICDRIEKALILAHPGIVTSIHVEPDDKAKHSGIVIL